MTRFRYIVRPGRVGPLLRPALLAACVIGPADVHATCLSNPDPSIHQLETLAAKDATKALERAQAAIDSLRQAAQSDPARLASLYAVQAASYSQLELDNDARAAASKGLELARDQSDPVHLTLLASYAENVYDPTGIENAIKTIKAARAAQSTGSLADTCLLITLGRLQFRQDHAELAILSLTQAYRASMVPTRARQRAMAADALSPVMRTMGDYAQALALNQEAIDWYTAHDATLSLSVARFLRGSTLMAMSDYSGAIDAFAKARKLSAQVGDEQGIAFADLSTCEAQIKLGQLELASAHCTDALSVFTAAHLTDMSKDARVLLANIDLLKGRTDRARATLNEVLDHGGTDVPVRRVAAVYELRARANASLGNYHDAYGDLDEYVRRYIATNNAERSRQATVLRARFETDREIERSASLQRELGVAQERGARQKELLRWTVVAIATGVLVIALLSYILVATLRHRRQLVRLANYDDLTSLPNRRYTAQLASAVLGTALYEHRIVAIAVIDLDHFKAINDRCGHAAGDCVLKEFARIGNECVRATDIFGRWGGEEFLLVMADTTLDLALVVLERLRARALEIALPGSSAGLRVTLSAGVATSEDNARSLDEILARADSALYHAKNGGRNLVRIADESRRTASPGLRRAMG